MEAGVDIFSLCRGTGGDINSPGGKEGGLGGGAGETEGGQMEGRILECGERQRLRQDGRETPSDLGKE